MTGSVRLLITRPHHQAVQTKKTLENLGFECILSPLLTIQSMPGETENHSKSRNHPLIITSSNAVPYIVDRAYGPDHLIYTVGARTKACLAEAGFQNIISADGNAEDLAGLLNRIYDTKTPVHLFHICGKDTASYINNLTKPHILIERQVVYGAVCIEAFTPEAKAGLDHNDIDWVLFYSARTAQNFERLRHKRGQADQKSTSLTRTKALCLSPRVVKSLNEEDWQNIHVSPAPNEKALINELVRLSKI